MLANDVDVTNSDGQSEANAVDNAHEFDTSKCSCNSPDLQTIDLSEQLEVKISSTITSEETFKEDCNLPSLPMETLLSPLNIIDRLKRETEVKDFLPFKCGVGELSFFGNQEQSLCEKPDFSEEKKVPMPYFIPELEMACANDEKINDINSSEIKQTIEAKIELPEIQPINEPVSPEIKETTLFRIEEPKLAKIEEPNLQEIKEINESRTEKSTLLGINEAEEKHQHNEIIHEETGKEISTVLQPKSTGILAPLTLQIEELMAPFVEIAKPVNKLGFISSLLASRSTWKPNVRTSFGDRVSIRKNNRSRERIQQEASKSLRALILSLNMLKRLEASSHENSYKSRINRFEKMRNSLTFSRVFRQNIFQLTSAAESSKNKIEEKSLACEPVIMRPNINEELLPVLYREDASEGLNCNGLNISKDSVFSDVYETDDSEIQKKLCVKKSLTEVHNLPKRIDNLAEIQRNGRVMFSQCVRVFCFNKLKEWKRQGKVKGSNETPYRSPSFSGEGQIEIMEHLGLYYIILHDKVTGELIILMRVDEKWRIDYMSQSSYSCRWTNINYACCREGILERIACSFREPSHAAEFVARIRNTFELISQ
ncbi:uncharacterized protein LOC108100414 isoform X2 [Drosophila ficusphila]|uniref:uncharacterized protein LOC108100414 isoform X2 n=1 Tax=Drosophila ficusphila TaxID=30025 RepID=UPI0007E7AEAC|nr:uncharacterized protein LOC108100414 isoform X2 [Drosophila ficusphila]